ncbi:MAG: hypothetical protein FWC71_00355 [Defluviitaleaceae bacterium]|nr:hypothetical protein [Defluviitaleaceae bacterium]
MKACLNIVGVVTILFGFFAGIFSGSGFLFLLFIALGILGAMPFFAISYLLTEMAEMVAKNKEAHDKIYALKNRIEALEAVDTDV